jgi:transcriptional regulator with XRE-family HTH domain
MKFKTENEIITELGLKLKRIRLEKNLTQREVSEKTGIDRSTISQMENGKAGTLLYFIKLVNLYGKSEELLKIFHTPEVSPMEIYKLQKKRRKQATAKKFKKD